MIKKHLTKVTLITPLIASVLLNSCIVPSYSDDGLHRSDSSGYVVYSSLPKKYVGSAYFYNGRYYSGGHYQVGKFQDRGTYYDSRYYYSGRYYYGGKYQHHAVKDSRQNQTHTSYRDSDRSRQP